MGALPPKVECEHCGGVATIHLTCMVDRKKRPLRLCLACAREPEKAAPAGPLRESLKRFMETHKG